MLVVEDDVRMAGSLKDHQEISNLRLRSWANERLQRHRKEVLCWSRIQVIHQCSRAPNSTVIGP